MDDAWRAAVRNAYDTNNADLVLPLLDQFKAVRDGDGADLMKLSMSGNTDALDIDSGITIDLKPPQLLGAIGLWSPLPKLGSARPGWPVTLLIDGNPLINATVNGEMDVSFDHDGQLPLRYRERQDASLLIRLSPARRTARIRVLSGSTLLRLSGLMLFRYCEPISGCQSGQHMCSKTTGGDLLVECQECVANHYRRHGKCRRCPALRHCMEGSVRCHANELENFPSESTCEASGCKPGFFGIHCDPCNTTVCANFSCTKRADNCDYERCSSGFRVERGFFKNACVVLSGPKKCRGLECADSALVAAVARLVSWMPSVIPAEVAFAERVSSGVMHSTCGIFVYPTLALPSLLCALLGVVLHPRLQTLVTYVGAYGFFKAIPNALFGLSWAQSLFIAYLLQNESVQRIVQKAWREVAPPSLQRFLSDELPVLADDLHECLHDRSMWPMFGGALSTGVVVGACLTVLWLWARRFRWERSAAMAASTKAASTEAEGLELIAERDMLDALVVKLQARQQRVEQLLAARAAGAAQTI